MIKHTFSGETDAQYRERVGPCGTGTAISSTSTESGPCMKRYRVGFSSGGYIVVSAADHKAAISICAPMLAPGELLVYVEEIT